jgi:D-beta-D-heptose 7-phosphate kinase/D-beta-D-heptose 1-phosphate adenosyltransferase
MKARFKDKIVESPFQFPTIRGGLRTLGKSLVLMKGVYDLCHTGHIRSFVRGSKLGDVLVVAVTLDELVTKRKGNDRPFIPFEDRVFSLANLEAIDYVIPNPFSKLDELLTLIEPNVFTASHFGGLGEELRRTLFPNVQFKITPRDGELDTTAIVAKIRGEK